MTSDPLVRVVAANPVPDPDAAVDPMAREAVLAAVGAASREGRRRARRAALTPPRRRGGRTSARVALAGVVGLAVAIVAVLALAPPRRSGHGGLSGIPGPVAAFAAQVGRPGGVLHMAFHENTPPGERKRVLTEIWEPLDAHHRPVPRATSRTRFTFADGSYDDRVTEWRGSRFRLLRYSSYDRVLRVGPWQRLPPVPPRLRARSAQDVFGIDSLPALGDWLRRGLARVDRRVVIVAGRRAYRVFTPLPGARHAPAQVWFISADAKRPTMIASGTACARAPACDVMRYQAYRVIDDRSTTEMPPHAAARVRRSGARFPDEGA